ncbi:hypothetical protein BLNAU_2565 [Blattamonas nauphoetae]|uniref:FAD dependent oxidoreductase domain-containing protein n=1 Tax=Blattamonas nauphoetae TaxID=2049346 RepID=A0ABQ9YEY0_9EUKA|nr:hypothetical protein BLNAU_2565 [Blattamonas nauphoetae]
MGLTFYLDDPKFKFGMGAIVLGAMLAHQIRKIFRKRKEINDMRKVDYSGQYEDVVIIGGGISGLATAIDIQDNENIKSITILERSDNERNQPITKMSGNVAKIFPDPRKTIDIFDSQAMDMIQTLLKGKGSDFETKCYKFENETIIAPLGHKISLPTTSYACVRLDLINSLSKLINTKKVKIHFSSEVKSCKYTPAKSKWLIRFESSGKNCSKTARMVVVAEGPRGDIVRSLGLMNEGVHPPVAYQISNLAFQSKRDDPSLLLQQSGYSLVTDYSALPVPNTVHALQTTSQTVPLNAILFPNPTYNMTDIVKALPGYPQPLTPSPQNSPNCPTSDLQSVALLRLANRIFEPFLFNLVVVGGAGAFCAGNGSHILFSLRTAKLATDAISTAFAEKNWTHPHFKRTYGKAIASEIKKPLSRSFKFTRRLKKEPSLLDAFVFLMNQEQGEKQPWTELFKKLLNGQVSTFQLKKPQIKCALSSAKKAATREHATKNKHL